jgi:hypothetical protein
VGNFLAMLLTSNAEPVAPPDPKGLAALGSGELVVRAVI